MFSENHKKSGCIEVICGSMFSGKTEELIRRIRRAKLANQKVAIFKPAIDNRYSEEDIISHDERSIKALPVRTAAEMLQLEPGVQVVGIDEAQFFDEGIIEVVQFLAGHGVRVIAAGLDMDYLGKPFGPMPQLMAIAEDVQKLNAICVKCGNLAGYSHRLAKSNELVVLGEQDKYEPLCRDCWGKALRSEKKA